MGYRKLLIRRPECEKINDWYYLLAAEGGTAGPPTGHMVVQARSKAYTVLGKMRQRIHYYELSHHKKPGGVKDTDQ